MRYAMLMLLMSGCCLGLIFCGCGGPGAADRKFERIAQSFMDGYFHNNQMAATLAGEHRFDAQLDDFSEVGVRAKLDLYRNYLDSLQIIDPDDLSDENYIDWNILHDEIKYRLFRLEKEKILENSPLYYNFLLGGALEYVAVREYDTWDNRINALASRLEQVPLYLAQARHNLRNPSRISTEIAIGQSRGLFNLVQYKLQEYAVKSPANYGRCGNAAMEAMKSIKEYQEFLQGELLERSDGDFRLGAELYAEKFKYLLSPEITPDELLEKARHELPRVRGEMFEAAAEIYRGMYPDRKVEASTDEAKTALIREVLDRIADEHPEPDKLLEVVRGICGELTEFVNEKDFLTLDPAHKLQVEWTPEWQRGVAVAGLDSPGPLDNSLPSFYFVAPVEDEWADARKRSYLREYNDCMLVTLSAHEAIPGHYVQGYYAARYPSVLRKVFGSGVFAEGWAMYAEKLVVEQGFRDGDLRVKLSRLKMYLRAVINTILDISIHTKNMQKDEAISLMTGKGFQELSEAEGKWTRACLGSCQLSAYFMGYEQVTDLRERYEQEMGDRFSLKEFNEELLSHGTPPVVYLREIMLNE